jgi:hypothetical protein
MSTAFHALRLPNASLIRVNSILAVLVFQASSLLSQTASSPHDASRAATSGSKNGAVACPQFANRDLPVDSTIEARVTELIDSSHLKPDKKVFTKVLYGLKYANCALTQDAILYGHVTAADSSKNPNSSELGLVFDHADCTGHPKQKFRMRLIGLVAPYDERENMLHDALPSEVTGGVHQLPVGGSDGHDDNLSPGGAPLTVHPGIVVRMPKVKLEPAGGPACSARIGGSGRNIRLGPGTELILIVEKVAQQ